jgi:hypothetical protein
MDNLVIDSSDRKYFTMIPNLVDDLSLSPFAFRLYCHFKRVAGENGQCWQSTRTLAEQCLMSVHAISDAKRELLEQELIEIKALKTPNGGRDYHQVTIIDIWHRNLDHAEEQDTTGNLQDTTGNLQVPTGNSQVTVARRKKNTIRITNEEKKIRRPPLQIDSLDKQEDLNNSEIPENRKTGKDSKNCVSRDLLNPFVESLASVTGLDKKLNYGRLAREAKDLIQAGYSVDQVQAVYGAGGVWYSQDWRGQKGELPQVGVIRSTIAQLLAAPKNGTNKKSNGRQPALDIQTPEQTRALVEALSKPAVEKGTGKWTSNMAN